MSSKSSITIRVPSSHLYRGMRLCTEGAGNLPVSSNGELNETGILLLFSDDSTVPSQLRTGITGDPVLHVDAYMTAQGTDIPTKIWHIKGLETSGDELSIWLGAPIRSAHE